MPYIKREWVDELLAEDPKYLITLSTRDGEPVEGADAGDILDEKARIEINVDTLIEGTPMNASVMNDMESRIANAVEEVRELASAGVGNLGETVAQLDKSAAKLTANQTFTGSNTFTVLPQCAQNPTADNQLTRKAYVDSAVTAGRPQLRSTIVSGGGWEQTSDNGVLVYRKTTGITGAGTAFPMLAAASGHLAQLNASFLQVVNVNGTIYLYSDVNVPSALQVDILLIERR